LAKGYLREHFADAFAAISLQQLKVLQRYNRINSVVKPTFRSAAAIWDPDRCTATDGADCRGVAVERNSDRAD
jgi:hypothetical protein